MGIQFEEEQRNYSHAGRRASGLVGFLVNSGLVEDQKQANMILLGLAVMCVLLLGFIWFGSSEEPTRADEATQAELLEAGNPDEIAF